MPRSRRRPRLRPGPFGGEITAGSISEFLNGAEIGAHFDLAGPGFHIVGRNREAGRLTGLLLGFEQCDSPGATCVPGTEVSLSSFFVGTAIQSIVIGNARVTVNGETLESAEIVASVLNMEADPVTIPKGNRKRLILTAPFTLEPTGLPVSVFNDRSEWFVGSAPPWAEGVITGSGVATAFLERVHVKAGKEASSTTTFGRSSTASMHRDPRPDPSGREKGSARAAGRRE